MNPEQLYEELVDLAEKLDVLVEEKSFKQTGIKVKSGFCLIKDRNHCFIDKHQRIEKKIDVLTEGLSHMPHEDIFVVPAVRDLLDRIKR